MRLGLAVSSWGGRCGVAETSRSLAAALQRLGERVTVLPATPRPAAEQALGLRLELVHFQYEYNLYDARELADAVAALARRGVGAAVTVHSWDPRADHANRILREGVPRFVVTLPAVRAAMERDGIAGSRVAVIPLGVPRHPLPARGEARAALGLGGEPAVGFFGFFHRHKGLAHLALAARALRGRFPALRCFLFAGAAPNEGSRAAREEFHAFCSAHGLWDAVTVRDGFPAEAEVVRWLHAMDVNVLPYAELPGVQASAAVRTVLAARRPTVVTATSPFSDLGEEVHRIADNAPERIAAAVGRILDDHELAARLAERAGAAAARLSWDRVAEAHRTYYAALLGGGRR